MKEAAAALKSELIESEVTNFVATCYWGDTLQLGPTWLNLMCQPNIRGYYEPELFTAITLNKPYHCKIFTSGKLYVTGVRDKDKINTALSEMCDLLDKCAVK